MSESNGNGNGNGNGHHPTPSEQAWITARERAREQGQSVREDEIRCIKSKALSCWAKLLFWILSKICWETSPFLHGRRVGSVCITGRQLAAFFGFPEKRLYARTKNTKDKSGAVVSKLRVVGAIEELEQAGLVWMSQKRIENIPSNKWPNVFNLTTLVPQLEQPSLGLLEGVEVVESSATNGGSSLFLAQNGGGSGQTPKKGLGSNQRVGLATTNGGSGQQPTVVAGSNQRGELATPPVGSTSATNGGSGQQPTGGVGSNHRRLLAATDGGAPKETVRPSTDPLDLKTGERPPPDEKFEQWSREVQTMFPSKLRKLQAELKDKLSRARSDEGRQEWKRRLAVVDERLLGGKVQDTPKQQPKSATPRPKPKDPTREEILEGARYAVSIGKAHLLTKAQKEALEAAR